MGLHSSLIINASCRPMIAPSFIIVDVAVVWIEEAQRLFYLESSF